MISALLLLSAGPAFAHNKGLYASQAEAEQRAQQLGCHGTHQNEGRWMPCADEQHMHHHLRQQ